MAWTLAFWLSTYAIFAIRGRLLPAGQLDWIDGKRFLAISCGALFFSLAIREKPRSGVMSVGRRLRQALGATALAAAALLALRVGAVKLGLFPAVPPAEDVRWLITWIGYFLGWIGFFLAASVREAPAPASAPAVEGDDAAIWVQQNSRRHRIPLAAIDWIEAEGNYAHVHCRDAQGLIRMSLAQLEKRLDPSAYVRLHRSIICRRDRIASVERLPTSAYVATLSDGTRVPVGRALGRTLLADAHQSNRSSAEG
jgi:hypothetical protein